MNRLQQLITKYGWIALVLHYVIFFASLGIFAMAIELGFDLEGSKSLPDGWFAQWLFSWLPVKWVGAYIATKVVQPARIGLTLVLTPYVAKLLPRRPLPDSVEDDPDDTPYTQKDAAPQNDDPTDAMRPQISETADTASNG